MVHVGDGRHLDRDASEVAEIRIHCFGSSDAEQHAAQHDPALMVVGDQELEGIMR